jgi:hypothetical protein
MEMTGDIEPIIQVERDIVASNLVMRSWCIWAPRRSACAAEFSLQI